MSLRLRLFLILILATGAIWLSAVAWINGSTRAEVARVLDARLAESAGMVSSLISDHRIALGEDAPATIALPGDAEYSRQLSCQIWSLRGGLLGASAGAPDKQLAGTEGFSTTLIDGEPWRVFTVANPDLDLWVMVGDRMEVRDRLVGGVVAGLLWPAAVIFPALAALIWVALGRGLAPLAQLETALRARRPDDLRPLPEADDPREIRPVRRALNSLFQRLDQTLRAERDFTAFAAHELKTPLAGLRTQAQIARMAQDPAVRDHALAAIAISVDRSDRMVRQLLDLTAIDQDATGPEPVDLTRLLAETAQDAAPQAKAANVDLSLEVPSLPSLTAPPILIRTALRNLVENAIQHSPPGGRVTISAGRRGDHLALTVRDEGPGIDPAHHPRVTERFWRVPGQAGQGSGLGLAIVAAAVQRLNGRLELGHTRPGQQICIVLPVT